jgi:hypothetical protein
MSHTHQADRVVIQVRFQHLFNTFTNQRIIPTVAGTDNTGYSIKGRAFLKERVYVGRRWRQLDI